MRFIVLICLLVSNGLLLANTDEKLAELQKAVSEKEFGTAQHLFASDTAELIQQKNYFELTYFIPYAGYIADHFGKNGTKAVENFRDFILSGTNNLRDKRQAYLETHIYFRKNGNYQEAYDMNVKALEISHAISDCEPREWAMIESNLGVIASEMNKPELAKAHTLRANKGFSLDPKTDQSSKLNSFNSLGAIYWFEAQYDSVEYFWTSGLSFIDSMEQNPTNQYYYRAMIEGNLSALYDVTGRTKQSIQSAKDAIRHIKIFTETGKNDSKWNNAHASLMYYSNNLAATYQGIGNYKQALTLFRFILQEKMANYPSGHPEIFFTQIQIGRTHYDLKNYEEAKKWLKKGIDGYNSLGENQYKKLADAYSTLALIAEEEGDTNQAKAFFKITEDYYSEAFQNKFDFVYLDFITHISEFYSQNNNPEKAIELSQKGLEYISNAYSKNSLIGFRQILNVGNVCYNLNDFEKSLRYANEGLEILENIQNTAHSGFDSLRTFFDKPMAVLLQQKSVYQLQKNKSKDFLLLVYKNLQEALEIVDKRKTVLTTPEDQQMLMVRFNELTRFVKKIQLELYQKTGDTGYIDELLKLKENSVYTKIRNQLNLIENIDFHNLPKEISEKEKTLKTEMQTLAESNGSISKYLEKMNEWQGFLEFLQMNYPDYYQLRYTGISADSLTFDSEIQTVRYIFIDSDLLTIVLTKDGKKVFNLNFDSELINQIPKVWSDPQSLGKLTTKLYQQLWEPFDSVLTEKAVMIIPDGILFNLSFDMLTPNPITSFSDFSTQSLLVKYNFSYHYSLWLAQNHHSKNIKSGYVGFVPGFSDQMKEKYVRLIPDSFAIDKAYLQLLPQPFTVELVNRISKVFRGENYIYEESTASAFKENASGNKIIHIGTHAESDNVSPGYSRLIFAKTENHLEEDNSLYAWEIYNTNMNSNLTILTACETANPVFQPGEGIISLAYAFQYAGSGSLLTSLWNQDEKAGMEISGYFLEFLARGMPKDKALKEAKLKYLSNNEGRSLSPQYWAGLILVGNPEPLEGLHPVRSWYWIAGSVVLLSFMFYFIYKSRKKQA